MPQHRVLEKKNPFQVLAAAGLSRLVEHMLHGQWGIVSPHSGEKSVSQEGRAENNASALDMKNELRKDRVGFIDLKGAWKSNELNKYVPEDSLFLVGVSPDFVKDLAVKYNQQAYIIGQDGQYQVLYTQSGDVRQSGDILKDLKVDSVNSPTARMDSDYSQIGGKMWTFKKPDKTASNKHYFCEYGVKVSIGPASTPAKGIFEEVDFYQSGNSLYIYLPLEE